MSDDVTSEFLSQREESAADAAAAELRAAFGGGAEAEEPADAALASPEEAGMQEGGLAGRVAKDVARGLTEIPRAIYTGAHKAVQETLDIVDELGDWAESKLPAGGLTVDGEGVRWLSAEEWAERKAAGGKDMPQLPFKAADPESMTGKMAQGVAQFVTGFIGFGKVLKGWKAASTGAKIGKAAVQGALADATVFDPHEARLSNLIQRFPQLQNPVTEFLAAKPEDGAAEGRFKNALEGIVPGVLVDGLVSGLRVLRNGRMARAASKAAGEYKPKVEAESVLILLGDAAEPKLVATRRVDKAARKLDAAAEATAGIKPDDVLKETAEPETFINFARIETPDDIQKVMQKMADLTKKGVDKAKRGVRTWEQTKVSAEHENAWQTLLDRRMGEPLNAEQSLAARQLWVASTEKMAEVARVAAASPSEGNLFAFRKMVATHYAIQKEVLAARTETARALNAWKIPAGGTAELSKSVEMMLDGAGGPEVTKKLAERIAVLADAGDYRALNKMVEGGLWAKTSDAVAQVWINSLLSNPTTHIVNAMSNWSVVVQQIYERKAGNLISRMLGTHEGVALGESLAMMHGSIEGFKDAMKAAWKSRGKTFLTEGTEDLLGATSKIENVKPGSLSSATWNIKNTTLGQAVDLVDATTRVPGKLLQTSDEFFKSIGYRMELHAQAVRLAAQEVNGGKLAQTQMKARIAEIIENPPEHIKLDAADAALYNTFQSKPAEVLNGVAQKWQNIPVLGRLTLPFRKTPINILTYVGERSPFAPLVKTWRADLMAGGARADLAMARMATGSMVMMAAMDLALTGQITGKGPTEPNAKANFKRMGRQEYSIKFGDTWYSFSRADPLGMTLGIAADIADAAVNAGTDQNDAFDEALTGAILAVAQNVTSKTYMEGMAGVFQVLGDPDRYGKARFLRIMGSFIPSGVAAVTRQVDPYLRVAADSADALKRRLPYWSKDLPPYRDLWGRTVDYRSGYGAMYDLFSPIYVRKENPEPIDIELNRLEYYPSMPPRQITYNNVVLDLEQHPHAYSRYVELAGNEAKDPAFGMGAKDTLNAILAGTHPRSVEYRFRGDGPDGGKAAMIRDILADYRKLAIDQLMREDKGLQVEYEYARRGDPYGLGNKYDRSALGLP